MLYLRFQNPLLRKLTVSVVEMQQLPDIEKVDFKKKISCLKRTNYKGKLKVRV